MTEHTKRAYFIAEAHTGKMYQRYYDLPKGEDPLWQNNLEFEESVDVVGPRAASDKHFKIRKGRRLKSSGFPKNVIKKGRQGKLADFLNLNSGAAIMVSSAFRETVESLEPGVHQFEPFTLTWSNGNFGANMYWFVVLNNLDSIAADHVDAFREERTCTSEYGTEKFLTSWQVNSGRPRGLRGEAVIFESDLIGQHAIWRDQYILDGPYCTQRFKDACKSANLQGISFLERKVV